MKRQLKISITALLLILLAVGICSCKQWEPPYPSLDEEGYTVSIRFDAGEGKMKGRNDVAVVEVFNLDGVDTLPNGQKQIKLLEPEDPRRGDGIIRVEHANHFLIGWYSERHEVIAPDGTVSYEYSGKWDFSKDTVVLDPNKQYTSNEPVLTLYAAWAPYFEYEFYAQNDTGDFDLVGTKALIDLSIPQWNQKSGKMDYFNFLTISGKTFEGAYADREMTTPITDAIRASEAYIDFEKGTATSANIKVYTTWLEGTWYKIDTAEQFYKNSSPSGNYFICADLDFSDVVWATALSNNIFRGTIKSIDGQTYKFSNIKAQQGNSMAAQGGIFGGLDATAAIENITFENVSYTTNASGRTNQNITIGLLAGIVNEGATLTNVTVSGELIIGASFNPLNIERYTIGYLFGKGSVAGIDHSGITCTVGEGIEIDVTLVPEDGTVILSEKTN